MENQFLDNLTTDKIVSDEFPLLEILRNSLYYPASGLDGNMIVHFGKMVKSFIYCDYGIDELEFINKKDGFYGYSLIANRSINKSEFGNINDHVDMIESEKFRWLLNNNFIKTPFAHWAVYQRDSDFDDQHGPNRFSLLFIGGEGMSAYHSLYNANKITPDYLAIVQPGTGFGGNWTDFRKKDAPLARAIYTNQSGPPNKIIYGGIGSGYEDFDWPNYKFEKRI